MNSKNATILKILRNKKCTESVIGPLKSGYQHRSLCLAPVEDGQQKIDLQKHQLLQTG